MNLSFEGGFVFSGKKETEESNEIAFLSLPFNPVSPTVFL